MGNLLFNNELIFSDDAIEPRSKKKVTKSDVTECFNALKKYGWKVYTFNHNYKVAQRGAFGFCDHVILNQSRIYLIEVKLYKDSIKDKAQYDFLKLNNHNVILANEENYLAVFEYILNPKDKITTLLEMYKIKYLMAYEKKNKLTLSL